MHMKDPLQKPLSETGTGWGGKLKKIINNLSLKEDNQFIFLIIKRSRWIFIWEMETF